MDNVTNAIPTLDKVDSLFLAISVESIISDPTDESALQRARNSVNHYFGWRKKNGLLSLGELVSIEDEDPEDSEYDSDLTVFSGSFTGTVTVDQWLEIADSYCLDIDWVADPTHPNPSGRYRTEDLSLIPAVPDDIVPTMGILTAEGVIPAVSIEHTDEGWGEGGYEPSLIASFYVAISLK